MGGPRLVDALLCGWGGGASALPASAGALGCLLESRISVHSSGLAEAPQPLDSRMVH